ncbi:hypothetical protein EV649_6370 [Kribbella sp. VKM Ac-2569]|nr:hypothetical protein EV649_6370 [Kribbella sp. VKM Ac-2569]
MPTESVDLDRPSCFLGCMLTTDGARAVDWPGAHRTRSHVAERERTTPALLSDVGVVTSPIRARATGNGGSAPGIAYPQSPAPVPTPGRRAAHGRTARASSRRRVIPARSGFSIDTRGENPAREGISGSVTDVWWVVEVVREGRGVHFGQDVSGGWVVHLSVIVVVRTVSRWCSTCRTCTPSADWRSGRSGSTGGFLADPGQIQRAGKESCIWRRFLSPP